LHRGRAGSLEGERLERALDLHAALAADGATLDELVDGEIEGRGALEGGVAEVAKGGDEHGRDEEQLAALGEHGADPGAGIFRSRQLCRCVLHVVCPPIASPAIPFYATGGLVALPGERVVVASEA